MEQEVRQGKVELFVDEMQAGCRGRAGEWGEARKEGRASE